MTSQTLIHNDGRLDFYPGFLNQKKSTRLFDQLWQQVNWQSRTVRVMGRVHQTPRLIAYFSDLPYRYSGQIHQPSPPPEFLTDLTNCLNEQLRARFNSILLNAYRNGNDSISWHADNEPELGRSPTIASLSLGAERRFLVRHRNHKIRHTVNLANGDLVVMSGEFQVHWQHAIPKTTRQVGARINLTFRDLQPPIVT